MPETLALRKHRGADARHLTTGWVAGPESLAPLGARNFVYLYKRASHAGPEQIHSDFEARSLTTRWVAQSSKDNRSLSPYIHRERER